MRQPHALRAQAHRGETLRDHSVRICEEMSYILRVNPTACRISKWTGESACQLLGELGGLACKPSLQQAVDMGVPGAAIALERIVTREKNAAAHVAVSSASSDTPFDLAQNPRAHTEDTAIVLPRDNTEQEMKLQVALRMDETEILERELAELAEAIFRIMAW